MRSTDAIRRLLALVLGCATLVPALAQQSRDELAKSLPPTNLTSDDVQVGASMIGVAPGLARASTRNTICDDLKLAA